MIDLDELEARIAEGEKKNFFVAPLVKQLIAELRELRSMRRADNEDIAQAYDFARNKGEALERAAVVAWLLKGGSLYWEQVEDDGQVHEWHDLWVLARDIERGEHRREEKK